MPDIGIVGFGFMGRMHFGCWSGLEGANVKAICDANPAIAADAGEIVGNIDGLPENVDLSGVNFYTDYDKFLTDEKLDAISLTLPTFLHADFAIKALEAGVSVLCEKPMALTLDQCDRMIAAAAESEAELMIAHCIRFWPEYAKAKEIVDSGEYGKVLVGHFQRLSVIPTWSSDDWMRDASQSGGMVLDLHIHDSDYVHYLLGMPVAVSSRALMTDGHVSHIDTQYHYDGGKLITAEGSWRVSDSFNFRMNFEILFEGATIVYDCTRDPVFMVYPSKADAFSPEVAAGDGYSREIEYFANLIAGKVLGPQGEVITPAQSKESLRIVEAEQESALTGKMVTL